MELITKQREFENSGLIWVTPQKKHRIKSVKNIPIRLRVSVKKVHTL